LNPAPRPDVGTGGGTRGIPAAYSTFSIAVLAVFGLLACGRSEETQASERPNVLLIVTDDQLASAVRHMPKLRESVGRRGVTFDRAFLTDPLCCPSRTTILTGKFTHNHDVTNNHHRKGGARTFREEDLRRDTIGTRLGEAGYATGYFGKWMNGYEGRHVPPGWHRWFAFSGDLNRPDSYDVNSDGQPRTFPRERNETDLLRDEAADFVNGHRDEPWMAVVATHAPHGPYWPPDPSDRDRRARLTTLRPARRRRSHSPRPRIGRRSRRAGRVGEPDQATIPGLSARTEELGRVREKPCECGPSDPDRRES
jgi:N-acetylglucosamine-6-sulfatase